jgi:hypothetical protein
MEITRGKDFGGGGGGGGGLAIHSPLFDKIDAYKGTWIIDAPSEKILIIIVRQASQSA